MKRIMIIPLAVLLTGIMSAYAGTDTGLTTNETNRLSPAINLSAATEAADSTVNAVRFTALKARKDSLEKEIRIQDGKRDARIQGVAPETLEAMNNRQDSICLALRSELVEVTLEIKELSPHVASPLLMQQLNNLISRKEAVSETENDALPAASTPAWDKKTDLIQQSPYFME